MALSMDERLDRDISGWKPAPGSKLVGQVIDRVDDVDTGRGYEPYSIVTIETDAGEITDLHCFHTTLRSEVNRRNPQPGDRFGVKYFGRVTKGGRTGTGFEKYVVFHERSKPDTASPAPKPPMAPPSQPRTRLEQLAKDAGITPAPSDADRPAEDDEAV